jgi:hypothetical protein
MTYIKPQITPPSPLFWPTLVARKNGKQFWRIWLHHLVNPPKILAIKVCRPWCDVRGEVWFGSFLQAAYGFLMISPNLHDIWVMFFLFLSQELKLVILMYFRTLGDGYSL